ncbi:putative transcriptional regulator of 2-aminoethylphosphonate degradation operons [Streptomyces sp. RB5]|uniref:Putative transcriptional regulator of 2-aminoethylphosphonate degradation operons n=1 Tax=Streptomyces smaragdinus TaxID=2585196 RepID=A0A7K0CA70_9ACTN|nr:GntR family transcriptional regulator [Streptomyces smaragdinus]MQY10349.1 putative transcriptional regulator of 2-aminoethylphosphonate degradation operons [Streptomyces smaragdinus]
MTAPLPPYLAIAAALRTEIESGALAKGDRLPSANELANRFETTNATAYKAVKVLQAEGLVVSVRGWATFVA